MPIVDAHVHVWSHDPAWPFAPGAVPPVLQASPDRLLSEMDASDVSAAVLVQPIQYLWDNRYLAHVKRTYAPRFHAVCRVNPQDPGAPDHLSRWVEEEDFRGVRLSPARDGGGDWFDGPLMDPLLDRAASLDVPLLLLTGPRRLRRLSALMDRHTGLKVCVDHMADVDPRDAGAVDSLLNLAVHPTVRVKISHTWSMSALEYPWGDTWDLVRRLRDTFGAQRLFWCSDWPVSQPLTTYARTLSVVRHEMGLFDAHELEHVLGGAALEWWPFPA